MLKTSYNELSLEINGCTFRRCCKSLQQAKEHVGDVEECMCYVYFSYDYNNML